MELCFFNQLLSRCDLTISFTHQPTHTYPIINRRQEVFPKEWHRDDFISEEPKAACKAEEVQSNSPVR